MRRRPRSASAPERFDGEGTNAEPVVTAVSGTGGPHLTVPQPTVSGGLGSAEFNSAHLSVPNSSMQPRAMPQDLSPMPSPGPSMDEPVASPHPSLDVFSPAPSPAPSLGELQVSLGTMHVQNGYWPAHAPPSVPGMRVPQFGNGMPGGFGFVSEANLQQHQQQFTHPSSYDLFHGILPSVCYHGPVVLLLLLCTSTYCDAFNLGLTVAAVAQSNEYT